MYALLLRRRCGAGSPQREQEEARGRQSGKARKVRTIAIIAACIAWLSTECVARAESAASIAKSCAPVRDVIEYTAQISGVPASLLTALFFAESTCNPDAINERTGARGLGQVTLTGAGSGYTSSDLTDKWINASISAAHLAMWARRCKNWRGAVEIYNGQGSCKARSEFGAKVVRYWKMLEREMERKS